MKKRIITPPRKRAEKVKKLTALSVGLCLCFSHVGYASYLAVPSLLETATLSEVSTENISVKNFFLTPQLETVVTEVLYGGDTEDVTYLHIPTEGMQFLLIYLTVTPSDHGTLDLSQIQVNDSGANYSRLEGDSFLSHHQYNPLHQGSTVKEQSGWCLVEVPSTLAEADLLERGTVALGEYETKLQQSSTSDSTLIVPEKYVSYVEQQKELDALYEKNIKENSYTVENPYIVVNPYEIAPQSALIFFDTEVPAQVTTVIPGRGDSEKAIELTTITNVIEGFHTSHQLPLIGLYEGANRVEVHVTSAEHTEVFTYDLETQGIPANRAITTEVPIQKLDEVSHGLYRLSDDGKTLMDINGAIRGYTTLPCTYSGSEEITEQGHLFVSLYLNYTHSTVAELDYLGRVYHEVDVPSIATDHDSYQLSENELLLKDHILDFSTMTASPFSRAWNEIFNQDHGSFEVRTYQTQDWLHYNTIEPSGDGGILFSARNQHAVAKLTWPELEVVWVLSVNPEACLNDQDKYLTPVGEDFEWFYSQHHIQYVGENPDGTYDVTLFDNGMERGLDPEIEYPVEEMYSRMVRYRIDEKNMTVEQIWDYGEEHGINYLSATNGSTQYLPESNTYLGNFNTFDTGYGLDKSSQIMTIAEVNENKEVILEFLSNTKSYRTEKHATDQLYAAWNGLGNQDGDYAYIPNNVTAYNKNTKIQEEEASYQIHEVSATEDYLEISGWVSKTSGISEAMNNRRLVLTHQETGDAVIYTLRNEAAQVKNNTIPEELKGEIHDTAGFYHRLLNISELEDGLYSLTLLATQDGKHYAAETEYTLCIGELPEMTEPVPVDDVIATQNIISEKIIRDLEAGDYTLSSPFTIVNPYGNAPLSAISLFETEKPAQISIKVEGLNGGTTLENTFTSFQTSHQIPIYGLYSQKETNVHITATYEDGTSESNTLTLQGDVLPEGFENSIATIEKVDAKKMAEGLTFYIGVYDAVPSDDYIHALDADGEVRFLLGPHSVGLAAGIDFLENGNILVGGDKSTGTLYYKDSFFEMDFTGRIYGEYLLENNHHDVIEGNNGNFFALGSDKTGLVVEETMYEIDPKTGKFVKIWDMDDLFPVHSFNEEGERVSNAQLEFNSHDWLHMNSLDQHPETGEFLFSSRSQDVIVSMNYDGSINYIIGDHSIPLPDFLEDKLLTPIGDDFSWSYGQHDAKFLDNGDILAFDNGLGRGKVGENYVEATDSHSRMVRYRVNQENMTIEQVDEFGADFGSQYLATYVSGAQELGENHYLINFGGITRNQEGNATYSLIDAFKGGSGATTVMEVKDGEVIFQTQRDGAVVIANTYRVERHDLYFSEHQLDIGRKSTRYGSLPVRNIASSSAVPTEDNLSLYSSSVVDNGVQLVCSFSIQGASSQDVATLVFVSEKASYEVELGKGVGISATVTKTEIPQGTYDLYLKSGDKSINLNLQWENTSVSVNPYDNVNFVQPNLSGSSGESGNTEGSNNVDKLFSDVSKADWFYSFVNFITENDYISPVSADVFAPYTQATRAVVVEALYRMAGSPVSEQSNPFTDVSDSDSSKNAILWAVEQGIVVGVTETEFAPESPVTREQLAVILNKSISVLDLDLPEVLEPVSYIDSDDIAIWAKDSVDRMQVLWLMSGLDDGSFHPLGNTSRAEFAVVLFKLAGEEVVLGA